MIEDAGFRWVRMDFIWQITEPERGKYDFSRYDRFLTGLEAHHLRAILILDYGNSLYTDGKAVRTAEAREAFARWAAAAATHFAGRGIVWEIFNEPNIPMFWPPKPVTDEYVALATAVNEAIQKAAPNERVIAPAAANVDLPFLEACFRGGALARWNAVSVHPYRHTSPESVAPEYAALRSVIQKFTDPGREVVPVISGEWGYSSAWQGMTEEKQAVMLARQFLTNAGNGISISIWYDWRDDGLDANEAEHHFGLVRHAYQARAAQPFLAKPAYQAARTLMTILRGYSFAERLPVGSSHDYLLLFRKGDQQRIAAWTTSPNEHEVTVRKMAGKFSVTRLNGEDGGTVEAQNGALSIEVTSSPVYLLPR